MRISFLVAAGLTCASGMLSAANYYCERFPNEGSYEDDSGYYRDGSYRDGYYGRSRNEEYGYGDDQYTNDDRQIMSQEDRELMNKIRMKLEGDGTLRVYRNIDIKVSQGIVTLRGSVDRQKDIQDLKSKIQDVQGVKRVNDKLEINERMNDRMNERMNDRNERMNDRMNDRMYDRNERMNDRMNDRMNNDRMYNDTMNKNRNSNIPTDRDLNQKAQDSLKSGTFTRGYENVNVDVRNGRATLRGTVNSDSERTKVQDIVQKIDGIESVDNQITVRPAK